MANEAFTSACAFVMPFGQHSGKTLARIGASVEGLKYLDWLIGQPWIKYDLRTNLETYLRHPAIAQQLDAIVDED